MATKAAEISNLVPALTAERPVTWPKRTRAQLSNGLQVVLAEAHSIPKFHGELFFRAGNALVVDRAPSLAEMTATVVRTGTAKRASRQIEEDLRRLGADLGTSAGQDTSAISFAGLSEFAEPLLQLVNELAREASFPEGEFERERRQKLEEVKLERTAPGFLAGERLRKVLFGAHPYAQISPSEAQVAAYRREDLQSVYSRIYTPENGVLMIVGDFDPQAMLKTIEKVFGAWTGKKPAAKETAALPQLRTRRVFLVHNPGSVQTQILAGCHAITRKHPDWIRLGLTNSLYGGAFNSRLVMNIREDKGYTYSPRSSVNPLRQHGYFSVSAAVRNEVVVVDRDFLRNRQAAVLARPGSGTGRRAKLSHGRVLHGTGDAGGAAVAILDGGAERIARRLSGNLSRKSARADAGGLDGNGAEILRFGEYADRGRRRSRADSGTGRALWGHRGLRHTGPAPRQLNGRASSHEKT